MYRLCRQEDARCRFRVPQETKDGEICREVGLGGKAAVELSTTAAVAEEYLADEEHAGFGLW